MMNTAELVKNTTFFIFIFFILPGLLATFLFLFTRPLLHKLKFGQEVRKDGPQTHLTKQGTPTMGGIVFLISLALTMPFFLNEQTAFSLIVMIGFGLIGLIDDLLKIKGKNTKGLHPKLKLALQILLAFIFMYVSEKVFMENNNIIIPFTKQVISLSVLSIPIMVFIIVGTDNAVNFTDGIDGLCSVVTIIVAIFFIIVSIRFEKLEIAILSAALIGVLSSFLIFNKHPASIFMGDVGSLFLGSFVGIIAYFLKIQLLIPIFGFVYFMEIISVIIQVTYFKLTKGKRIFKMAPIHHHFELCGFSENKIVLMFAIITLLGCMISYFAIF